MYTPGVCGGGAGDGAGVGGAVGIGVGAEGRVGSGGSCDWTTGAGGGAVVGDRTEIAVVAGGGA